MIHSRCEAEGDIFKRVGESLDWPIEVGGRRIGEEKMLEAFRNQAPAPDKRIAQHERLIVPDEVVAQRGRVDAEDHDQKENEWKKPLHRNTVDSLRMLRV